MFSDRITSVDPSGIREIFELVGGDAINLGLGEPDYDPPARAKEALQEAICSGMNKYGPTSGLPQLREALAGYLGRYRDDITAANVMVTAGATEALMAVNQSLFQAGDEVLVPEPGFVLYHPHVVLAGATPVPYGLREEKGFDPDLEEIQERVNGQTKGLVVNSPSNPTGGVLSRECFRGLVDIAEDHGLWIVSDEVYDNLIYEGEHHSFCRHLERSVVVNSFSKSLATTGWRIGYLAASTEALSQISKMHYYTMACPSTPLQYAVWKAMPEMDSFLEEIRPVFERRRSRIVELINRIPGLSCDLPRGAFYAFPSYDADLPSMELAKRIASRGVICSPGSAFGPRGEGHLRFSYAASEEHIDRGMAVVRDVMEDLS
ncbi:MAG: pyridoxal phosphate-dependent aminotransferase [Methanomassiliicoccales archaeon]